MTHIKNFLLVACTLFLISCRGICCSPAGRLAPETEYVTHINISPFEQPAWSPDGMTLAVKEFNLPGLGDTRIFLYSMKDEQLRSLVYTSGYYASLSWSPDSKKLLVARNNDYENERDIQIVDLTSKLSTTIGKGFGAAWSPDGQTIAVYRAPQSKQQQTKLPLDIIRPDGQEIKTLWLSLPPLPDEPTPAPVTVQPGDFYFPPMTAQDSIQSVSWSPDSQWIVVSVERRSPTFKVSGDLYVMSVEGTHVRQLTFNGWNHQPAWSPDGKTIAYLSGTISIEDRLWLIKPDGTCPVQLSDTLSPESLSWSPDSSQLVYENGNSVYVLDVTKKLLDGEPAKYACP